MVSMVFGRLLYGGKYNIFQYREGSVLKVLFWKKEGMNFAQEERLWRNTFPLPRKHVFDGARITLMAVDGVAVARQGDKYCEGHPEYVGDIVVTFVVKEWSVESPDGENGRQVETGRVADVLQFKREEK